MRQAFTREIKKLRNACICYSSIRARYSSSSDSAVRAEVTEELSESRTNSSSSSSSESGYGTIAVGRLEDATLAADGATECVADVLTLGRGRTIDEEASEAEPVDAAFCSMPTSMSIQSLSPKRSPSATKR